MYRTLEIKPCRYVSSVSWSRKPLCTSSFNSTFDDQLMSAWKDAQERGCFRYIVSIGGSTEVPGKYNFFVELNPERGENRRKPQEFHSVSQPFNPALFNFTQIKEGEVLFEIKLDPKGQAHLEDRDLLAINVSPINEGHSLILPCVNSMQNQALTEYSIDLGLKVLLSSSSPSFRIAFNSLCGFASVNHLHLHCLYIEKSMKLEYIGLQDFEGPCYLLTNYPGKGFVFQCQADQDDNIKALARNVHKLSKFFQSQNEAHNVIMTRSKQAESDDELKYIRVYVWVRKPNTGAKEATGFNPAALELFGYFIYKNYDNFRNVDEDSICKVLENLTHEPFDRNLEHVRQLFGAYND